MPNWVYNSLTIQGPKEQVDLIKEKLNRPFTMIHDTWNMQTQQMEVSQTIYSNPVFAFHNIYNHRDAGITDEVYLGQPPRDITFEEQMWSFPKVSHDDVLDAVVSGVLYFLDNKAIKVGAKQINYARSR